MVKKRKIAKILSIAGSDPSGGAGIQADLKTFSALGCYGMAVITALTAQNTRGVDGVFHVPPDFIAAQIETLLADIRPGAVKIGMAGTSDSIKAIATMLKQHKIKNIVLDPVMVAQSGDRLLPQDAMDTLRRELVPLADILTPNIPEAKILLGDDFDPDLQISAKRLMGLGAKAVYLKDGHGAGAVVRDVYAEPDGVIILETPRIETKNNHGTGCTLAAALACFLARGERGRQAARHAKDYLNEVLRYSDRLDIGHGAGPVHHFHALWRDEV